MPSTPSIAQMASRFFSGQQPITALARKDALTKSVRESGVGICGGRSQELQEFRCSGGKYLYNRGQQSDSLRSTSSFHFCSF